VWTYGNQTIPRHLRDIVVTEYGVADLRGRSDHAVIEALLAVADSRFQDELLRTAKDAGKVAPDYEIPKQHRDNTPERLARRLQPFRDSGLLPDFPFGTDFTETEQALIPALQRLRSAASSPLALSSLVIAGLKSDTGHEAELARMQLTAPRTIKDWFYAKAMRGALIRG
jgi:hypothetical protein